MATDEKVNVLQDFIFGGLGRDDAVKLLKISNNDVEAAASKFYDTDPSALRKLLDDSTPAWDDTLFGSGRYGPDDKSAAIPTFNIDYAPGYENYPHSGSQSKAPTRPPSRTSLHSAVSTHHGDAPMQSIENTQESGLIGNSHAVFGPATKDHYDPAQWAVVPSSTAIIPDPDPKQRQRPEGEPAILKPSPRFNYLPALIAILHSIPLYRNALLAPDITQSDYYMGDGWWKGNPAMPARIIDTAAGVSQAYALDIIHEAQRLMAFLDMSDRAYATVSSLMELDAWKESRVPLDDDDDDLLKFLLLWSTAYQTQNPNAQFDGWLRSLVNVGGRHLENFVLDATVFRNFRQNPSLYDVLDDMLFDMEGGTAHIMNISKVLILRLTSNRTDAKDLGCYIPATLYADRYLEINKPVIDGMYNDMKQYEDQLKEIDTNVQRLKFHTPKKENAKPVETLKMLETSMKAFRPQEGDESPDSKDAAVLSQLQTLYHSIESKLATLDEQTKQARATMSRISARFKPMVDDGTETLIDITDNDYPEGLSPYDAMHHPYQLHGVATYLGVVYLLRPETGFNVPQWWRVQYDTDSASPTIRRDRVTQQEVLERASTESASALLIYAHKDATSVAPLPLSKPLAEFVQKDSLNFMEELQKDVSSWEDMDYDTSGDVPQGGWDKNPPDYEYDWTNMSAQEFHKHERHDSNLSSATLTPNTENDDDGSGGVREMVEVNGGMDALTGLSGSETRRFGGNIGEAMEIDGAHGAASFTDRDMEDAHREMRTQHIEIAEKKGG